MANERKRIGTMPCEGQRCESHKLNIPVVVFENDKGTLSYRCDYCSRAKFTKAGTEEHDEWMEGITLFAQPDQAEPAAPETPAAPAAPAKAKAESKLVF